MQRAERDAALLREAGERTFVHPVHPCRRCADGINQYEPAGCFVVGGGGEHRDAAPPRGVAEEVPARDAEGLSERDNVAGVVFDAGGRWFGRRFGLPAPALS